MPAHDGTGTGGMHGWAIITVAGALLLWLVFLPSSLREHRLRTHGRAATAVCRQHLNPETSDGPIRVRCAFRPDPGDEEYEVVVKTYEYIPEIGAEFTVIYDPKNPRRAENVDVTARSWYGNGGCSVALVWLVVNFVVMAFASATD